VDNCGKLLWITLDLSTGFKLSTVYPQGISTVIHKQNRNDLRFFGPVDKICGNLVDNSKNLWITGVDLWITQKSPHKTCG
jgi:hypothetical protein